MPGVGDSRGNLGKDAGEKGKRRITQKGRQERKKVGRHWSNKWRWTREVARRGPEGSCAGCSSEEGREQGTEGTMVHDIGLWET